VSYTLGDDIGAAVAALMEAPKWDKYTFINGDTVTWHQAVEIAEKVTGIHSFSFFSFLPSYPLS
jgi:hypothetical protein